jgi:hypothetical protein
MAPAGLDYARVAKHALLTPAAETPAGDPRPAETRRFERVLRSAFAPVRREGRFDLMRRVNGVPGDICDR